MTTESTKKTRAPRTIVTMSINDHGIEMLTIKTGKQYPVWISVGKALAILGTNDNADAIEPIKKHNKDMFSIMYPDGRKFTIGENKVKQVLDAEAKILLAMHASIDNAKEA